jgi:hypothetical protein
VDVSAGIAYTSTGERINFPGQAGILVPDASSGGTDYILLQYSNFQDTPVAHPVTGVIYDTRNQDQFSIIVSATLTPTALQIPVAQVTRPGGSGPLVIQDLRVFLKTLGSDTVGTSQIINNAVIASKLANYVEPVIWNTLPDIYYSKELGQVVARGTGTFNLTGVSGLLTLADFPVILPYPVTQTNVLVGSISGGLCNVSVVPISTFGDFSSLPNAGEMVLGFITTDGIFVNLQAPEAGELVPLAEEDTNVSATRIAAFENMWRRTNESFQSFTPLILDNGASNANAHLVSVLGGNFIINGGVSYVAGRRIFTVAPSTTLNATNTFNYPSVAGTSVWNVYILRNLVSSVYRFEMVLNDNPAPVNSYLVAQVNFTAGLPSSSTDEREFSPFPQTPIVASTAQGIKVGAKLKNTTAPADIGVKILVEPGVVGFADGTIRQNLVAKEIDFSTFQASPTAIATASQPNGYLQSQQGGSPIGLEPFSHYAIFATADHSDKQDFNVVAVKVPFFKAVAGSSLGGGQYQYTIPAGTFALNELVYPGQKIRATRADYTGPQPNGSIVANPALTEYTADNAITPETILSVTGNLIVTEGISATPLVGFTGGTFTVMDKFRPDPILTGVVGRYRLLGFVTTDGTSVPNTVLKLFQQEGNQVLFEANGNITNKMATVGGTDEGFVLDMQEFFPACVKLGKILLAAQFHAVSTNSDSVTVAIGPGDGLNDLYSAIVLQTPIWGTYSGLPSQEYLLSGSCNIDTKIYMGFITIGITSSLNIYWSMHYSNCIGIGYEFDVFGEWCKQTITGGIGGFVL